MRFLISHKHLLWVVWRLLSIQLSIHYCSFIIHLFIHVLVPLSLGGACQKEESWCTLDSCVDKPVRA
jgi:hypothetical protein